jgi:type II secretory pathway component PulJ
MKSLLMNVKDYVEYRMKEKILNRKKELEKQMTDLVNKINQGRDAIRNMESSVGQIQGAIQQCNWTIDEMEMKDDESVAKK